MLCTTSREADFLLSSICVINGTEIPDFSARNCCVHPNSFLIFRMLFPNTKRISVIKIIILLFFVFMSIKIFIIHIQNLKSKDELLTIQEKLNNLLTENKGLENQIETGLTPDFVEKIARNKLKMVSPHERVFFNIAVEN